MKKSFAILPLLLIIALQGKAQKEVLFKIKMLPDHHYSSTVKMDMNMMMNADGDSAIVKTMNQSGQFPMLMKMENGMTTDIKTGSLNGKNGFGLIMNTQTLAVKMTVNGKDTPVPVPAGGQLIYGSYADGKMNIDSLPGKKLDAATKQSLIQMMEGIQSSIKFPDKPMKIGDNFVQDIPMDIPMAGFTSKMVSHTVYKLTSIQNNNAYFDMTYNMDMDMSSKTVAMTMKGSGTGKVIYDITASYPVSMTNNMDMTYNMPMPGLTGATMAGSLKMNTDSKTVVTGK